MKSPIPDLIVIGGGLAGSEAAWQAAQRGLRVHLYEMRPGQSTGAHATSYLAELVCSNSLGSLEPDRAPGQLKHELQLLNSCLLTCAFEAAVPAGGALAVDRGAFASQVTDVLDNHPNIDVIRREIESIPEAPAVIASGPLTSPGLANAIAGLAQSDHLYFFDAIAPIVYSDTVNLDIAFRASRYQRGDTDEGDYINCPLNRDEYTTFIQALLAAERIELKSFENEIRTGVKAGYHRYFEGCLPVEIMAQRSQEALAFGPMRPVGLLDPRTGKHPYAVVQLRQDNLIGSLYNLVGFQTNLTYAEQRRVFRLIPGLEKAEFARFGQMHRNTFINSPRLLRPTLQYIERDDLFFAGQITGVEGYAGNIATGLLAGWNAARLLQGKPPLALPKTTILGALCHYITSASPRDFQPMKANFGLLPPIEESNFHRLGKRERGRLYAERANRDLLQFLSDLDR